MSFSRLARALACVLAILSAGCHGQPNTSNFGIAWVSLTDEPGDYTSYVVTIDSVTLTRNDGVVVTAVGTPEIVDLVQVHNIAEMWSSGAIPDGIYVSATITIDYTNAAISFLVNGKPVTATKVIDYATGATPATFTYSVTVNFDPQHQPNITPTFASTSAALLSLDFDLAASGRTYVQSDGTAVAAVRPFLTIGALADNTKLIRVRGPLINSSTDVNTYTVAIRPFFDEANNLGQLTLFSQPNTIYTLNGVHHVGNSGLTALSVLSAGTTMTAGYTTFQPDYNPANQAYAGRFNLVYVVAGSTLEDVYTEGISGDVIARNGNTVTLLGSTLFLTTADTFAFEAAPTQLLLGPGTIVTADDDPIGGLTSNAVAVGQHITARGVCIVCSGTGIEIDATGTSSTNTGSVRLQSTELWGSLVSSANGGLTMNLQTIDNFPIADFDFAGNGASTATTPQPAAFSVNPNGLALPTGTAVGDPLWVVGLFPQFGTAPPDFTALALNNELSVQTAGGQLGGGAPTAPGIRTCGIGSQVCDPASLEIVWASASGNTTPFNSVTSSSFSIDVANPSLLTGVIRIGPESIALQSLPAGPLIVPTVLAATQTFAPRYAWGNVATSTTTSNANSTTALDVTSSFADFVQGWNGKLTSAAPALQLHATGVYDRTTNTFTATNISFVL
jgi:Domain of unknown function (DUF4382)